MYLIDTSVWVEILLGSAAGHKAMEFVKKNECFVLDISFAELSKWCISNHFDAKTVQKNVEKSCSAVLSTTRKGFLRAGTLWHAANPKEKKTKQAGLIDCIIASAAEENSLAVFTKDRHFLRFAGIPAKLL